MATSSAFTLAASHGSHQRRHREFKGREINDRNGGEGGILTQSLSASYHVFSNMHENRMDTGDLYDFAFFNCFNPSAYIAPISAPNRHQRHQTKHRERDASQTSHNGISVADLHARAVRAQLIELLPSRHPGGTVRNVAKSPDVCPRLFRGRVARGLGYSYRKATMRSTRMARRAGR